MKEQNNLKVLIPQCDGHFYSLFVLQSVSEFSDTAYTSKVKHVKVCSIRRGGYRRTSGSFFIISPAPTWGNSEKARVCMCNITGNGRRGIASIF